MDDQTQSELIGRLLRLGGARPAIPDDVTSRVKVAAFDHWKKTVRRRRQLRIFSFAFLLAVSVAAALYYRSVPVTQEQIPIGIVKRTIGDSWIEGNRQIQTGMALPNGSVIQSSDSGQLLVHLFNHVALRLDKNSKLELKTPTSFVLHQGTVYMDCDRLKDHVTLLTSRGVVRDNGTQFEVRLQNGFLAIAVREGSITWQDRARTRPVTAGRKLIIDESGNQSYESISAFSPQWDWLLAVAPPFIMEGKTLNDYLGWLTRETGWTLVVPDPALAARLSRTILHGSIAGLQPQQTPQMVLPICGLAYNLQDGRLTISAQD